MPQKRILTISSISLALLLAMFFQYESEDEGALVNEQADPSDLIAAPRIGTASLNQQHQDASADEKLGASTSCLSPQQFVTSSTFREETRLLDSIGTGGPSIAAYRNLTSSDLESLAKQGDSAAMVVFGTISELTARRVDGSNAVTYLLDEDPSILLGHQIERPLTAETLAVLNESSKWYYEAAKHGRLAALLKYANVHKIVGRGPVELGWISSEDFASLSVDEKRALSPKVVYEALMYDIAPQLRNGIVGAYRFRNLPRSEAQGLVLSALKEDFYREQMNSGLPRIDLGAWQIPDSEDVKSMLCDDYETFSPAQRK